MTQQESEMQMQQCIQQITYFQQQLQVISEQLKKLDLVAKSVKEVKDVKLNSEILAPLSNGIFVKAKITDNKTFAINSGADIILEKDEQGTIKMIEKQKKELKSFSSEMEEELHKLNSKIEQLQKSKK